MPRSVSLPRIARIATLPLALSLFAAGAGGCQLIAGLGGEETKGTGGTGGSGGTTTSSSSGSGGTGLTGPCTPAQEEACYGGPDATKGVGLCKEGTAICGEDSMWGACNGETLPQDESCANDTDEDCNGYDCAVWVNTLKGEVYGNAVGVDGAGNVYAAVVFYVGTDFGDGDPVVPLGNGDMALLKYDRGGALVWKKAFTASGQQNIRAIDVAEDGTLAIGGDSDAPLDLGSGQIAQGAFVAKLDADGKVAWATAGQGTNPIVSHVALDPSGNVFVGGSGTSVDFGEGPATADNTANFFVGKLEGGTGKATWLKITKGGGSENLTGLAVDTTGSVVLAGTWDGMYMGLASGADMPPNDFYNCCGQNAPFLIRLEPDGTTSDGKMLAGYNDGLNVYLNDLAIDKFGVSTMVGSFYGVLDLSSGTYDAGMDASLIVIHDQTSGFSQWSKAFIQAGVYTGANQVAIDGHNNMVMTGSYGGAPDFGGGTLSGGSAFVLKLDKDGNFLWNRGLKFGDGGVQDLAAGTLEDETVMIGTFYGTADLGTGPIDAQQGTFIAKLGK